MKRTKNPDIVYGTVDVFLERNFDFSRAKIRLSGMIDTNVDDILRIDAKIQNKKAQEVLEDILANYYFGSFLKQKEKYLFLGKYNKKTFEVLADRLHKEKVIVLISPYDSGKTSLLEEVTENCTTLFYLAPSYGLEYVQNLLASKALYKDLEKPEVLIIENLEEMSNDKATQKLIYEAITRRIKKRLTTIITISSKRYWPKAGNPLKELVDNSLILQMGMPLKNDRVKFIETYCNDRNIKLSQKTKMRLAEKKTSLRKIELKILKLFALAKISNKPIPKEFLDAIFLK